MSHLVNWDIFAHQMGHFTVKGIRYDIHSNNNRDRLGDSCRVLHLQQRDSVGLEQQAQPPDSVSLHFQFGVSGYMGRTNCNIPSDIRRDFLVVTTSNFDGDEGQMIVKIKKLNELAVIPKYAKPGDAGLDLTALWVAYDNGFCEYGTGLVIEIPKGFVGLIFPRSSISKTGMSLCNAVGVIDSSYRGEIKLRFYDRNASNTYKIGDRIGQLIVLPYPQVVWEVVDELSETERGEGGFGSSGG